MNYLYHKEDGVNIQHIKRLAELIEDEQKLRSLRYYATEVHTKRALTRLINLLIETRKAYLTVTITL